MVYFNSNLLPELREVTINDLERLIQALHEAFAEDLPKISLQLTSFRDGEELCVSHYDYSELYNGLTNR